MHKLKKNTNIGRLLYSGSRVKVCSLVVVFLLILGISFLMMYIYKSDTGYPQFDKNLSPRISAEMNLDRGILFELQKNAQTDDAYYLHRSDNGECIVVLISESDFKNSIAPYCVDNGILQATIRLRGLTRTYGSDFMPLSDSVDTATMNSIYGNVYLDTTIKVLPPVLTALAVLDIIMIFVFLIVYISSVVKDLRVYNSLCTIENDGDEQFDELENEVLSVYNVAVDNEVLLTHNFCINRKRSDVFALSTVMWLYLEADLMFGNPVRNTLVAYTTDGKRHIVLRDKKPNSSTRAAHVAELILERTQVTYLGYDKESREGFRRSVSRLNDACKDYSDFNE